MRNVIPFRRRSRDFLPLKIGIGIAALAVVGLLSVPLKEGFQNSEMNSSPLSQTSPVSQESPAFSRSMPICGQGRRINCVVDGDTLWFDGEKIRLDSMNAPEVQGQCGRERDFAARATRRLSELLSARAFKIVRNGKDRYGRTLATVTIDDHDVGVILVGEGLAHPWQGGKRGWC